MSSNSRKSQTDEACERAAKLHINFEAAMTDFTEQLQLNDIDFGIYIEDVLTRIMYGEHVDDTFLLCGYVPRYKEGQDAA